MQVDLSNNYLGPEGAKAIAPGIRDSSSITQVCAPTLPIHLHVQTIRQVGALCFSCLIRTDFRISSAQVDLCGNDLDNSAKQMLRDAVQDRDDFILLLDEDSEEEAELSDEDY